MSSIETLKERVVDEYGNIRTDEHGFMKGSDVFNFVIIEIPKDIKRLVAYSNTNIADMDFYVFHQANNFINSYIAKKMKLDTSKIPSTIHKYGNTSSVSVPLTIVSELKDKMEVLIQNLDVLREGILSAHYNALKDKCVMHINAGHISIYELDIIEEEFTLYKKLGGNGHMDALIVKVRKLPIEHAQ